MLTVFLRAILLFAFAVAAMRLMGKRQVGQFQPFELVVAIMIAELASTPMEDVGTPLLYGVVPMAALVMAHGLVTVISMKSQRFREIINGKPTILIQNGVIRTQALEKLCFTLNDLMEELRMAGMLDPAQVGTAIMETSGQVSVFPKAEARPVSPADLHFTVAREGIPLTLVLEGVVQTDNLQVGGVSRPWLMEQLNRLGYTDPREVLLCSLNTSGQMLVQGRQAGQTQLVPVLAPDKVRW